jgi:cobalt/nickel transport system permease protein
MLFAVHMPDGVIDVEWLVAGAGITCLLVLLGLARISEDQIPRVGVLTAALFVATLLHLPVGFGKVHLLLNAVAGILLGRYVGMAVLVALTFQVFLFAHGGLYTLGINSAVVGLPAVLGFVLFRAFRPVVARRASWTFPIGFGIGGFVSGLTVALNALVIWLGMPSGGAGAAITVLVWHVPVIAVESVGTGVLLAYLAKVKPDWLGLPHPSTGVTSSNGTSH